MFVFTELVWPKGRYGLVESKEGCPSADFSIGCIFHTTEATNNNDRYSSNAKINGRYVTRDLGLCYCAHKRDDDVGFHVSWPQGQYCVYQGSKNCPTGFKHGSILWDDEDGSNKNRPHNTIRNWDAGEPETRF